MKMRSGFVSNSSSSSFVLYGVKFLQSELPENLYKCNINCIEEGKYCLVGKTLASEIEDMELTEITPSEDLEEKIKETLISVGVDMTNKKFGLFVGNDYC